MTQFHVSVSGKVESVLTNPDRVREDVTSFLNRAPARVSDLSVTVTPIDAQPGDESAAVETASA